MIYLAVLSIVVMVVVSAVPVIVVLRAPLWQEYHLGERATLRATVTATVVRPIPSPRPLPRSPGPAITGPRIITGTVENEERTS